MNWRERFFGPAGERGYVQINNKWQPARIKIKTPGDGESELIPVGEKIYVLPKNMESPLDGRLGNRLEALVVPDIFRKDRGGNLKN